MKTYYVEFKAGNDRGSVYVEARNSSEARKVAMGQIMGQAGYIGKRINIIAVRPA